MKLLIVTDAWFPQINGVVRTLSQMREGLTERGWEVQVLGPTGFTLPCPTYPEIRLTLEPTLTIKTFLRHWTPEAVHIATEGPLGRAMRAICAAPALDLLVPAPFSRTGGEGARANAFDRHRVACPRLQPGTSLGPRSGREAV